MRNYKVKSMILIDDCDDKINNDVNDIRLSTDLSVHTQKVIHGHGFFVRHDEQPLVCGQRIRVPVRSHSHRHLCPGQGTPSRRDKNLEFVEGDFLRNMDLLRIIPEVLISPLVDCWPVAGGTSENRWLVWRHVASV